VDSYTLVFHYERLAKHLKILEALGDPGSIDPQREEAAIQCRMFELVMLYFQVVRECDSSSIN
jgi:hypothetical protein